MFTYLHLHSFTLIKYCPRQCCLVATHTRRVTVVADADVVINDNISGTTSYRVPAGQPHAFSPPHIYAVSYTRRPHVTSSSNHQSSPAVTSSRRRDSVPRDERRVTFADDSSLTAGEDDDQNPGTSTHYGSSEFSDVTSITSGSYYIGEELHRQPVSFLFV